MKTALNWLYVGHDTTQGIALTLIWLQCPFYWAHEFEEYELPFVCTNGRFLYQYGNNVWWFQKNVFLLQSQKQ